VVHRPLARGRLGGSHGGAEAVIAYLTESALLTAGTIKGPTTCLNTVAYRHRGNFGLKPGVR